MASLWTALLGAAPACRAQASATSSCPPAAPQPTLAQIQAAQATAQDRGLLWRLSKGGRTSWLYGTVHLGKLDWAAPGPVVREALSAARVLAVEVDITDPASLRKLQTAMARRPDEPPLPLGLQQRLQAQLARACLPEGALSDQQHAARALSLLMMAARWEGLDAAYGQEAMLLQVARARGLPARALETVDEQMGALLPADSAQAALMVEQALSQLESGAARRVMRRLAQAWAEGRLDDLAAYEQWCECVTSAQDRELLQRMNDDRNPALASRIHRLHQQQGGGVFAAVGALHMIGPRALPALLQQQGFVVERVSFAR